MLTSNPAAGTKKYRSQSEGHHSWTEGEIAQFERHYPIGSKARLALALGLYTAQRKGDVLRMGWQHVTGDCITVRQEKTDAALLIPMHPRLVAVLASVPRSNLTFLMTEHGRRSPRTALATGSEIDATKRAYRSARFTTCAKRRATRLANAGVASTADTMILTSRNAEFCETLRYKFLGLDRRRQDGFN